MTENETKAELERLRKENAALKKGASSGVRLKVSEKGAVSVYGMGRFPVTLYKEQWLKLLDMSDDIRAFITANEAQLKEKDWSGGIENAPWRARSNTALLLLGCFVFPVFAQQQDLQEVMNAANALGARESELLSKKDAAGVVCI
jgi:hypothetical protein